MEADEMGKAAVVVDVITTLPQAEPYLHHSAQTHHPPQKMVISV